MNYEKINEEIKKFVNERDWDQFHSPKNLSMALSVEASELVEIYQWQKEGYGFVALEPKDIGYHAPAGARVNDFKLRVKFKANNYSMLTRTLRPQITLLNKEAQLVVTPQSVTQLYTADSLEI